MDKLGLLTDEPISVAEHDVPDRLGFKKYAEVLARAVLDTEGPFTIGVLGEWGTGKTSLMKMIETEIREQDHEQDAVTVWFNAWRYEQDEHPIVPLVTTVLQVVKEKRDFLQKLGEKGENLIKALRSLVYGFSTKASAKIPGMGELEVTFQPKDVLDYMDKKINGAMERSIYYGAIEALSKANIGRGKKIVVLIDDLDRCFPDRAIKLLETIKLILSQPNFFFVLGVSRMVIEGYLEHRYKHEYGLTEFRGEQYLDKIIQLPFILPPHSDRIQSLAKTLLSRIGDKERQELETITDIIGPACDNNPREVVQFINKLLIAIEIKERKIPIGYFAVTLSLQQRWKKIFGELSRPSSSSLCSQMATWKEVELSGKAKLAHDKTASDEQVIAGRAAESLSQDDDLVKLLLSPPGRKWLADTDNRQAAIHYLNTQIKNPPMEDTMSLIHSSWRSRKHDRNEYCLKKIISLIHGIWRSLRHGRNEYYLKKEKKMYRFDAVIDAPDAILNQIEAVNYHLHPSYPDPVRIVNDRPSRFKLRELAWGSTTLRAEVKMKNRKDPIILSHFITLNETGPRI